MNLLVMDTKQLYINKIKMPIKLYLFVVHLADIGQSSTCHC